MAGRSTRASRSRPSADVGLGRMLAAARRAIYISVLVLQLPAGPGEAAEESSPAPREAADAAGRALEEAAAFSEPVAPDLACV